VYKEIKDTPRMHENEAVSAYPDKYILMRMDGIGSQMGMVLFVGDTEKELIKLLMQLENSTYCGVFEGTNIRRSLGGVVVGG
jgi:hypothetical protein